MFSNYHSSEVIYLAERVDEDVDKIVAESWKRQGEECFDFFQKNGTKTRVYTTSNDLKN